MEAPLQINALPRLISLLRHEHGGVAERATRALAHVARRGEAFQHLIAASGAAMIPELLLLLGHATASQRAMAALMNLADNKPVGQGADCRFLSRHEWRLKLHSALYSIFVHQRRNFWPTNCKCLCNNNGNDDPYYIIPIVLMINI